MKRIVALVICVLCVTSLMSCGKAVSVDETVNSVESMAELENVVSVNTVEHTNEGYSDVLCYDVVFKSNGLNSESYFVLPDDYAEKKYPVILWFPDAKITDYRFVEIVRKGFIVVPVFSRGYSGSQSEGMSDFGGEQDLADVRTIIDLIVQCRFTDNDSIFAVSNMQKSISVFRYLAAGSSGRVKAAAFVMPITDMNEYYEEMPQEMQEYLSKTALGFTPEESQEEYNKRSAVTFADKIDTPLLLADFDFSDKDAPYIPDVSQITSLKAKLDEYGKEYKELHYGFAGSDFYFPDTENDLVEWIKSFD